MSRSLSRPAAPRLPRPAAPPTSRAAAAPPTPLGGRAGGTGGRADAGRGGPGAPADEGFADAPPRNVAAGGGKRGATTSTGSVAVQQRVVYDKVGRNDPCPCGSGKKYKKCHGA